MVVMSFDLSTACIGVIVTRINDDKTIDKMLSCPIIPNKFSPECLGYMKSKKKLPTPKSGELLNTYYKEGETTITKAEKQRRDREVRGAKDIYVLQQISKTMGELINSVKPDLVLVEKNVAGYNGMLTIVLLAKVMGTLVGICGMLGIELKEYPVNTVRKILNVAQLVNTFTKNRTPEELIKIPDITKRALREKMSELYGQFGVRFQTDDESDACVVFNYWFAEIFKGITM